MAYIKSISVYEHPQQTIVYITQEGKLVVKEITPEYNDNIKVFVDGVGHKNLTAKIIQNAKREIAGSNKVIFDYVIDESKTEDKDNHKKYVSTQNCSVITAAKDFENIQKLKNRKAANYQKGKREVKAHHFIQSFKPGEGTPEQIHKIGLETAYKYFGADAQIIVATHTDQDHLHNHILVNSVNLNGNKITMGKNPLQRLRNTSDIICNKYGLSIIPPKDKFTKKSNSQHYKTWSRNNPDKKPTRQRHNSWHDKVRLDIDRAIVSSNNFEDFLIRLDERGYKTKGSEPNGRKYFAIAQKNKDRFTRTKSLGENYTEDRIRDRIADPDKHAIFAKEESTRHSKLSKIAFLEFSSKRKPKYMASNSVLMLQYLSTLEILFRLIINNAFKESKKFDLSSPYGLFNDYHFVKYLHQLFFLEANKIQTKEDYRKLKNNYEHISDAKEDVLAMLNDIDETIEGFEIAKSASSHVTEAIIHQQNNKNAPNH